MKKHRDKTRKAGAPIWRGPTDGPWPRAEVDGELEAAEPEWLITNELGTYAMSTMALMHTRRQHGMLVTHLGDDFRRYVVLSHLEMTIEVAGRTHQLSTHQFPNVAPTLGYQSLQEFSQDPLPRWVFRLPKGTVERTLAVLPGSQSVVLSLTWTGKKPARLLLRPLMPMRPSDELCVEHGGMLQKVVLRPNEVTVQPLAHLPEVTFRHSGVFMGSPDWWRKFEYLDDRVRYEDFQEDMWTPGVFEIELQGGETASLVVGLGSVPKDPPKELVLHEARRRLELDPGPGHASEVRALWVAAESFVLRSGESIVAGYPWLDVWARDALLSLRGIFLARGQVERGKYCYRKLLSTMRSGMLPRRTTAPDEAWVPSLDATLWLFQVGEWLMQADPGDQELRRELFQAFLRVFERIESPERDVVWLTHGFLENSAAAPLTWMDAHDASGVYTPRQGCAVELQALWVRGCHILARLAEELGELDVADRARLREAEAEAGFRDRFWCFESSFPFDCISAETDSAEAWADPSIRPNALIALAVAPGLFEGWQRAELLAQVEERLLTDQGLRTLEPGAPQYVGHAGGSIQERRAASHQGTIWPHLLVYYVRAALAEGRPRDELIARVRRVLQDGRAVGYVPQTADGDAPHRKRGSPAYAQATAMLLETLVFDLALQKEGEILW